MRAAGYIYRADCWREYRIKELSGKGSPTLGKIQAFATGLKPRKANSDGRAEATSEDSPSAGFSQEASTPG